jgi:myosin heavy subunit
MLKRNSQTLITPLKLESQLATPQQDLLPNLVNTSALQVNRFKSGAIIMQFMLGGIVLMLLRDLTTHFFSIFGPLQWKENYLEKEHIKLLNTVENLLDSLTNKNRKSDEEEADSLKAMDALKHEIKPKLELLIENLKTIKDNNKQFELKYKSAKTELSQLKREVAEHASKINKIEDKTEDKIYYQEELSKIIGEKNPAQKKAKNKSTSKTSLKEEVSWTNFFLLGLKTVFKPFSSMSFPVQEYVRKNWFQPKILGKIWPKTFPDNTAHKTADKTVYIDSQVIRNRKIVTVIKKEEKRIKDNYNLLTATEMKTLSVRAKEEIEGRIKQSKDEIAKLITKAIRNLDILKDYEKRINDRREELQKNLAIQKDVARYQEDLKKARDLEKSINDRREELQKNLAIQKDVARYQEDLKKATINKGSLPINKDAVVIEKTQIYLTPDQIKKNTENGYTISGNSMKILQTFQESLLGLTDNDDFT